MSERSGGTEAPPTTPTDGSGDDIYASAAASNAGRSRAGEGRRPTVKAVHPTEAGHQDESADRAEPSSGPAPAGGRSSTATAEADAEPTTAVSTEPTDPAGEPDRTDGRADGETAVIGPGVGEPDEPSTTEARQEKRTGGVPRGTRRARLRLSRLDPWSVMKTAFMFSIAAGIVLVVAVYAVWLVIGSSGLFESIDSIVGSVLQSPSDSTPFRIGDYINTQKVMGVTAFLACVDVVIFTALATLASFLYNLAAVMLGGLEVTLAED